ncbi:MAG TPA: type 4a pilus biogenesis protein PilO [Vicinamibacterales bacterium]|nr:type 4a pilus biogenesis protein PilO [Vicinamibacterales bacterium]
MTLSRVLSDKRRLVVPLLIAIVANVLLYAVVVFPLGRQVAGAEAEANTQHDLLNRARQDHRAAKATVAGKQQADAALQKFYKDVLPVSQSAARTLTYTRLSQLAEQANVRLEQGANAVEHEKGSTLAKSTTSYTLTGDYRNVRRFIYSLETIPEFIVLENIALTSPGEPSGGRTLAMRLDIATYYRSGYVGS